MILIVYNQKLIQYKWKLIYYNNLYNNGIQKVIQFNLKLIIYNKI